MRRVLVVYNPRSSQFGRVEREVLSVARGLKGWMVGKYEVRDTDVDDNAARLARVILPGDLVVAAGGDGTATIALNGVMKAGKEDVRLGVMPYGNFNDMARSFGMMSFEEILEGRVVEAWAMECLVNGRRWRWGMCYFTVGLFAEACAVFDGRGVRRELRTGRKGILYSVWLLARWYFGNRKRRFMGDFVLERSGRRKKYTGMTDYVALNGRSMAKMMRGGEWFLEGKVFRGETRSLSGVFSLMWLMAVSILRRVPGVESSEDVLNFREAGSVMIQAEGEYKRLENVKQIRVKKVKRPVLVVMR